jgi:hypothetical protein
MSDTTPNTFAEAAPNLVQGYSLSHSDIPLPANWANWPELWRSCYRDGFLAASAEIKHLRADRAALVEVLDRIVSYNGHDPATSLCRTWAKNAIAKHGGQRAEEEMK